jgi:TorA maturation chaperone TorD
MLKNDEVFSELPFAAESEATAEGRRLMEAWLGSGSAEILTDKARSDFMHLFIGPGKVLSPPWGSVYMSTDKLIFTEETLNVRLYYERNGRIVKKKYHEPDDHIGLELEFIAYLLENDRTDTARDFAEKYVIPWVFKWNDAVQKYAGTDYYRSLANMAAGGVQELTQK